MKIKAFCLYDKETKDVIRVSPEFYLALAMRAKPYGRIELRHATITVGKKYTPKKKKASGIAPEA